MDCRQHSLCYLAAAQLCLVKNCSLQQCSLPCSLVFECRCALWPIFVCNQRTCFSGPSEQVLCNTAELCCSSVYKHHSSCLGKEAAVLTCTEARLQMLSCSEATRKKKTTKLKFHHFESQTTKMFGGLFFQSNLFSPYRKDDCFHHKNGDSCVLLGWLLCLPLCSGQEGGSE